MGDLNKLAGIGLSIYFIAVVFNGNTGAFIKFLSEKSEFLKWCFALFILYFLAKKFNNGIFSGLLYIGIIAMFINTAENQTLKTAAQQINSIFGVKTR
jgi:hypothetical protein